MPVFQFRFQSLLDQRSRERLQAEAEFGRCRDQYRLAKEELNRKEQDHRCTVLKRHTELDVYNEFILDPDRWPEALQASDRASRLEAEADKLQKCVDVQHAEVITRRLHAVEAAKVLRECRRQESVLEKLRDRAYEEFLREENDRLEAEREGFNITNYAARRKKC